MRIWRICRAVYAEGAFSGEGARRFGGRWNSRGVPMVYSSTSLALAAIELFVYLDPAQSPDDLVSISAVLPEGEPARMLQSADLPPDWWSDEALTAEDSPRDLGDEWIRGQASLAIQVPSVPIRLEWNVLVNPLHSRIGELKIDLPQPFVFDARMFAPKQKG